jgi:hypothetical protein
MSARGIARAAGSAQAAFSWSGRGTSRADAAAAARNFTRIAPAELCCTLVPDGVAIDG